MKTRKNNTRILFSNPVSGKLIDHSFFDESFYSPWVAIPGEITFYWMLPRAQRDKILPLSSKNENITEPQTFSNNWKRLNTKGNILKKLGKTAH